VFNPTSRAFDTGLDPCDQNSVGNGPNPSTRRANCVAAGINPDTFISDYSNFTVPVTISGNRGLTNEKANSGTVGAIVQPRFMPGFNLAVDWINIKLKNAIVSLGGDDILNACYDSPNYPNSFCGLVDRGPDGQITGIREGYYNAAERNFAGLTVAGSYRHRLGAGTVGLSVNYLYLDKLEQRVGLGDIDHTRGEIGQPKHSGTANLTYGVGGFTGLLQAQYFGKSKYNVDEAANARDPIGVGDWWLFNATLGYDVNRQFALPFIADNIFDRAPPYPVPAGGGTVTYYSGVLGRYFRIQATTRF
jgi:hypothetical protein